MTYLSLERMRFTQLLELGTDDDELRRFFSDTRLQLIQKGAKVQNPPHGKAARVRMLVQGLPPATDRVVQRWFSENLKMLDPTPVDDLLIELRLYEEAGESPPEDDAKRLARSCLVHLFSDAPPVELISFLRPAQGDEATEAPETTEESTRVGYEPSSDAPSEALARTLVALAEGRDPDEFLSSLSPSTAAFVAGIQAVRSDRDDDATVAMEALDSQPVARTLLAEYAARRASARSSGKASGLQILSFVKPDESFKFNFDRDEVLAVCTRDYPETAVFLHPSAIRTANGTWIDLSSDSYREELFFHSGDLIAFPAGRDSPRQPKRGEIGIWRVAENKGSNTGHRTNFHIASEKTLVYEVRDVPLHSSNRDAVRDYIKHTFEERGSVNTPLLFVLQDPLIIGTLAGRDLTRDEGFDVGLPCWHSLPAFRFEGRTLVPGPLPPSGVYECESLASSLRKLFAGDYWDTDKPTKALARRLQDLIGSGVAKLSADRAERLRAELTGLEKHEGAMSALLDEVMRAPFIEERVGKLVQEKVDVLIAQKDQLRRSVQQLEQRQNELLESKRQAEREQKAIAPAIRKEIRGAFDKARADALRTLGEVAVFKALIDELVERPAPPPVTGSLLGVKSPADHRRDLSVVRASAVGLRPVVETLRALGVTPKAALAIHAVGVMTHECGLMLVIDGIAGRVAAEAWMSETAHPGKVFECGFGEMDDRVMGAALNDSPGDIVILDANLSPFDVYARPLLDAVLRRLAGIHDQRFSTRVVMSVVDGMAALPLSAVAESISLRVNLDRIPVFLDGSEAAAWLEEVEEVEEPGDQSEWFVKLWKPARSKVLGYLRNLPLEEVAMILAALEIGGAVKNLD